MGKKSLKRERDIPLQNTDTEKPAKRRRQINADDIKLSKLYDDLAAESDDIRLEAAKQIIVKFSPANQPSVEATEKVLHRLVRGLCSQRKAARFGFCVTLTELLRQFFGKDATPILGLNMDVDGVIQLVEDETKVEGNVPGQVSAYSTFNTINQVTE
jgi:DNA polymerase phi